MNRILMSLALFLAGAAFTFADAVTFKVEPNLTGQAGTVVNVDILLTNDVDLQIGTVEVDYGQNALLTLPNGTADVTVQNNQAGGANVFPTGATKMVVGAQSFTFGDVVFPVGTDVVIATLAFKIDDAALAGQTVEIKLAVSEAVGYGAFKSANSAFVPNTTLVTSTLSVVKLFNANDDAAGAVLEDSGTTQIDVLTNDSDDQGVAPVAGATVVSVTQPAFGGAAAVTGDSLGVTFTPTAEFNGNGVTFTYTAKDTDGNQDTGTVTIDVTPVNDKPTADAQTVNAVEDVEQAITLTGAATDPEGGQTLTFVLESLPATGSLAEDTGGAAITVEQLPLALGDANIFFKTAGNDVSSQTFDFHVMDDGGTANGGVDTSDAATVTVNITAVNDEPTADAQTVTALEDVETSVTLTGDDGDADATQTLTYVLTALPATATLAQISGGAAIGANDLPLLLDDATVFVKTAANDVSGQTFDFHVMDDGGTANGGDNISPDATVTVNVTPVNDKPTADAQTVATDEEVEVQVTLTGDDNDADAVQALSFVLTSLPATGVLAQISGGAAIGAGELPLTLDDADVFFTPATDDIDPRTFDFHVMDDGGTANGGVDTSDDATITVNVTPINDLPIADDQSVFIRKLDPPADPTTKTITLTGTDVDNANADLTFQITAAPTRGTLDVAVNTPFGNGDGTATVVYTVTDTATEFYAGNPAGPGADTFQFTIDDGVGASREVSVAAATVTVTYRENQPPQVVSFSVGGVNEDLAGQDTQPQQGTDQNIDELQSLDFTAEFRDDNDPSGLGAMAVIKWYVDGVLRQAPSREDPMSSAFTYQTDYDTIAGSPRPQSVVVEIKAVGEDTQGGTNEVAWNVTVNDVDRATAQTNVTIAAAPSPAISASDLTANMEPGVGDTTLDPDGDAVTRFKVVWDNGARASFEQNPLTADKTVKGETWTASVQAVTNPYGAAGDEVVSANVQTAQVTINNTDPTADPQTQDINEDTQVDFTLTGTDRDVDDGVDTLKFAVATQPAQAAIFTLDADTGAVSYKPTADFNGQDTFTFTVDDQDGGRAVSAPATVTINIAAINDVPVALDTAANVRLQDAALSISVNIELVATDVDGAGTIDFFTIDTIPDPAKGSLELLDGTAIDANGFGPIADAGGDGRETVVFIPAFGGEGQPPVTGAAEFTFSATDNGLPAPGKTSTAATATVGIGTPPWFPVISWGDATATGATQYNINIIPVTQTARQEPLIEGVSVSVTGKTLLLPIDYVNGGSRGLTGAYSYQYRVDKHAGFDETPTPLVADTQFYVDDYGIPTADSVAAPERAGAVNDLGNGLMEFTFNVGNSSGFRLEVYDNVTADGTPIAMLEEFFGIDPDTGLVEFVGPFVRRVQLPDGAAATLYWRVRGFNPNVTSGGGELSSDGAKLYGPWSDAAPLPAFANSAAGNCVETPQWPADNAETAVREDRPLTPEPDQTAGQAGTLDVELEWQAIACATAYFVNVRNFDTGATAFEGFARLDDNNKPLTAVTLTLGPGRYVWTVSAFNANAPDGNQYSGYAPIDDFRIIPNAVEGRPGLVGNLLPPDIDNDAGAGGDDGDNLEGFPSRPIFQLRCNNATAFDIRIFDFVRRQWSRFRGVPNIRDEDGQLGAGAGTQTIFVVTQIRVGRAYKYQARGRFVDNVTGEETVGPWSRVKFFVGGDNE